MSRTRGVLLVLISLWLMPYAGAAEEDPWQGFRSLVGTWEGKGSGFGSVSDVLHEWHFVLDGKFLRLCTRSMATSESGSEEAHEDVGFLSHDTDRNTFVFRQFLSEGFVNTYDVALHQGGAPAIDFECRATESAGGMRARMRLQFVGLDEYRMVLELASPGKDFVPCQQMEMKRIQ